MNLKLSKWCEIIGYKLRQKSLYFELKYYMKNNQSYFRRIRYWERGIGKTYSLIKLSQKFKCPIAVPNIIVGEYIKRLAHNLHIYNINIILCNQTSRGRKYDKILCEEGINENFINEILKPMSQCLVGYVNMDLYYHNNEKKFQREYQCEWIGGKDEKI